MAAELTCNSCKNRVSLSTMRYSKDGAGLICDQCYNKQYNGLNIRVPSQMNALNASKVDNTPKKKVDYTCKSCRFRFSRGIDYRGPKLCPSCGKDTLMYNLPTDADDLLRELDRMDDV